MKEQEQKVLKEFYDIDPNAPYYPTGVTLLDEVAGGGLGMGYAGGKFVNVTGDNSAGKSFLQFQTVAANIFYWKSKGVPFKWMYDDAEYGSTFDIDSIYGISDYEDNIIHSSSIEQFHMNLVNFLNGLAPGERGIYILDSLDPLKTDTDIDAVEGDLKKMNEGKDAKRGSYDMAKQKYLSSRLFPQVTALLAEKQAICIVVSQVRYNVTGLGAQFTVSGGKAAEHYYNTRIMLTKQKAIQITTEGETLDIGAGVKAKLMKNKCPRPNRECQFDIYFTKGVDDVGACIDYLYQLKTPQGQTSKRSTVEWDGQEFKGGAALAKYIYGNKLVKELRKRTIDKWERLEEAAKDRAADAVPGQQWEW